MANAGKVAPQAEKLTTDQSEQTLIDIRRLGMSPKVKIPKPSAEVTASSPKSNIDQTPPGWGKSITP